MKLLVGVALFSMSVIFSYVLSRKFVNRREFYVSFKNFNSTFKREVLYTQNSIPKILESLNKDNDFCQCLKHFYSSKNFVFEKNYLNSQDLDFLQKYLTQIGKSDKISQQKFIENIDEELNVRLSEAVELEKKYKNLYIKLGVLLGLIALIICL